VFWGGVSSFCGLAKDLTSLLDDLHGDWNVDLQVARIRSGRSGYGLERDRCAWVVQ